MFLGEDKQILFYVVYNSIESSWTSCIFIQISDQDNFVGDSFVCQVVRSQIGSISGITNARTGQCEVDRFSFQKENYFIEKKTKFYMRLLFWESWMLYVYHEP